MRAHSCYASEKPILYHVTKKNPDMLEALCKDQHETIADLLSWRNIPM